MNQTIRKAILKALNAEQAKLVRNREYLTAENVIKNVKDKVDDIVKEVFESYEEGMHNEHFR